MDAADRIILHVDMDAFYAAVEVHDDPTLAGKPLIIGGLGRRGVVSTASYEARRFGVRSAMPIATARRLCPEGIYRAPRMSRYVAVSARVFAVFAEVTPLIEGLSLDEAFLDVSASRRLLGDGPTVAARIKNRVREDTGLTCSIGVSHNKLLAKLASEMDKPDGLTVITRDRIAAMLDPLPVGRMWTIGRVAEEKLRQHRIETIGQLRTAPLATLARALGETHAASVRALAAGLDERPVVPDREEKSIGNEHTFDVDLRTLDEARAWVLRMAERVGERTRHAGLSGRTVTLKIRVPPFETATRQATLREPTAVTATIAETATRLLETWWKERPKPLIRLLGVTLSGFDQAVAQDDLFAAPKRDRRDALADQINAKFGGRALRRARTLATDDD